MPLQTVERWRQVHKRDAGPPRIWRARVNRAVFWVLPADHVYRDCCVAPGTCCRADSPRGPDESAARVRRGDCAPLLVRALGDLGSATQQLLAHRAGRRRVRGDRSGASEAHGCTGHDRRGTDHASRACRTSGARRTSGACRTSRTSRTSRACRAGNRRSGPGVALRTLRTGVPDRALRARVTGCSGLTLRPDRSSRPGGSRRASGPIGSVSFRRSRQHRLHLGHRSDPAVLRRRARPAGQSVQPHQRHQSHPGRPEHRWRQWPHRHRSCRWFQRHPEHQFHPGGPGNRLRRSRPGHQSHPEHP